MYGTCSRPKPSRCAEKAVRQCNRPSTSRAALGFSMLLTDSGMSVAMICTLGSFFSMWAASQILPSGPFFASTYWE